MKKLSFAIIGCGRISHKHIEALANNFTEADLVSVCDIVPEKMDKDVEEYYDFMKQRGINLDKKINKYTDYKEMLKREDIDVVSICTESGHHAVHALYCLNAGKHVLVEKPMALSLNDADKMIKLSREKNLKLGICHQNRFNSPIQKLRRAVEEGRFGRIINGTARILWNRNDDYYKQAPWRGTKALDGGTLMNQCIHNIDLLQWMMGSEVERVHCERGTFLRNIEMEDFGAILIRFKNGSIGIVEGSACVYPKNLEETLSIFGEKGTVVIGGLAVNKIKTWQFADERDYDKEDENTEIDSVYGRGHTPLYKNFIDAVNENRVPLINGEEGRKALEIILRAYGE
ncbi:Gfo/Idh/MocA family oxidoreductase [Acidilutibacter cellobiosedens]|uniref:Gfo/Idh/MocA family oxidoreductase n=1 Tax=Acidilutibacter cellobiosedens TaxID=2507161 RepID=A0A410QDD9_9FIRM|nr:Gfo/Idh/MocA family oxidoreductase [Acidilutibacter cellobiosedens]QAT62005.1 Gfo/Idh/MocA family oxidoreductase [Acidilutibacter cellobiosedens]